MGFGASTTVGNVAVDLIQTDVDGIIAGIANGKTLADLEAILAAITAAAASGDPVYGADDTGQDAYAEVLVSPARQCHYAHVSTGDNGAIISFDGGTTDHVAVPPNTERLFPGLKIASEASVQAKNLSAGDNYTNTRISVW